MRPFELLVRFPGGGPLVGGATEIPHGFHASHAQLPDGRPYLPATALRGALRESLEAILRGSGEHRACAAGDGVDPELGDASIPDHGEPHACTLGLAGSPCLACRLFGTRRRGLGAAERAFSGLVLGDALAVGAPQWTMRPSVALGRATRSAADKQLVFQRVPQTTDGAPLTFTTLGRVDPTLAPYLSAAARATTHIGASRSRGLARVALELAWRDAPSSEHASVSEPVLDGDLLLRVTLTSPALVGVSTIDANHRETRHEIPGSAVRGAVGFALRELLDDCDGDRAAQDLLVADGGAQFGFLYPTDGSATSSSTTFSAPLPITAAACKREQQAHGVVDTLLDRLALLHAVSAEEAERATQHATKRCAHCGAPLRAARGSRLASRPPATRTIVRAAMDRTRQSARDGQLFSQVLLAPGVTLEGTIRNIPLHSRRRLDQALRSGIVSFGRGRSSGWGQARIDVARAPERQSLADRAMAFDRALHACLDEAGLSAERVGRLVPVTLLSPLWPMDDGVTVRPADAPGGDGERDLRDAIGPATSFLAARRFAREGAWDQRTGQMTTFQATVAGGVFVFELREATWRDVVVRLEALERDGIGRRRDQGYGQIVCFDPHFVVSRQNG